jgi:hypothetical protein
LWDEEKRAGRVLRGVAVTSVEIRDVTIPVPLQGGEVPPLKWSILRYGFSKEDHDGKKETYS